MIIASRKRTCLPRAPGSIKEIAGQVIKVNYVMPGSGMLSQMAIDLILCVDHKQAIPVYLAPRWYLQGPGEPSLSQGGRQGNGHWVVNNAVGLFAHDSNVDHGGE